MSKSSELFMEMRASEISPDEYFHWLTTAEEAEEENQFPEMGSLSINDLDNLFTCADDDEANS